MKQIKASELYTQMPYIKKGILKKGQKILIKVTATLILPAEVKERTVDALKKVGVNYNENQLYILIDIQSLLLMDINPLLMDINPPENWTIIY